MPDEMSKTEAVDSDAVSNAIRKLPAVPLLDMICSHCVGLKISAYAVKLI